MMLGGGFGVTRPVGAEGGFGGSVDPHQYRVGVLG